MQSLKGYFNVLGKVVVALSMIALAALLALLLPGPAHGNEPGEGLEAAPKLPTKTAGQIQVEAYIAHQFQNRSPKVTARAMAHAPAVAEAAERHGVDPLLVAVVVYCESTFRPGANGDVGERGLMQVHGEARRGFDMEDPAQQVEAGITWLLKSVDKCRGNAHKALTRYQTGSCSSKAGAAAYRLKLWRKERERQGLEPLDNPFSAYLTT